MVLGYISAFSNASLHLWEGNIKGKTRLEQHAALKVISLRDMWVFIKRNYILHALHRLG